MFFAATQMSLQQSYLSQVEGGICIDYKCFELKQATTAGQHVVPSLDLVLNFLQSNEDWVVGVHRTSSFYGLFDKQYITTHHFAPIIGESPLKHLSSFLQQVQLENDWLSDIAVQTAMSYVAKSMPVLAAPATECYFFTPSFTCQKHVVTSSLLPDVYAFDYFYFLLAVQATQVVVLNVFFD